MKALARQCLFLICLSLLACQGHSRPLKNYQSWWDMPHFFEAAPQPKILETLVPLKPIPSDTFPLRKNIAVGFFPQTAHPEENQQLLSGFLDAYWRSSPPFKATTRIQIYDLSKLDEAKFYQKAQQDGSYTVILQATNAASTDYATLGKTYYNNIYEYIQSIEK